MPSHPPPIARFPCKKNVRTSKIKSLFLGLPSVTLLTSSLDTRGRIGETTEPFKARVRDAGIRPARRCVNLEGAKTSILCRK